MENKGEYKDDIQLPIKERMIHFLKDLQDSIVSELTRLDTTDKPLKVDDWQRGDHSGRIIVLQDGKVFEKAGVTMSVVKDRLSEARRLQLNTRGWKIPEGDHPYIATGLSLVFHPKNPFAPTVHLNYRYFEVSHKDNPGDSPLVWWFGGGSDLTPAYYFEEDAIHFHTTLKQALDPYGEKWYPKFKKWCDDYFYLPHRQEHRGIGGIFFDDLTSTAFNKEAGLEGDANSVFELVKSCGNAFIPAYFPILEKRMDSEFNQINKDWQQLRRGRYVEFNLVYDRGTHFGLKVPGIKAENILVSLPLYAKWEFEHSPEQDSEEEKLLTVLKSSHDWLGLLKNIDEKKNDK